MALIVSEPGTGPATVVVKSRFAKEEILQEYIHAHPEAIPIYDIHTDKRLFVAAREFPTNSGPIDALAVDNDGDIYIIETKLFANADKRRVVAQALDYGASIWNHVGDFGDFLRLLDEFSDRQWGAGFRQKFGQYFGFDDDRSAAVLARMGENLRDGNLKFVILMDSIDERLKELIAYVNSKSQFDIYAVQLELYEFRDLRIVLPKVFGAEARKDPPRTRKDAITEFDLLNYIAEKDSSNGEWARELFRRLGLLGLTTRGTGSTLNFGLELPGGFAPILAFQASSVYAALPVSVVRSIGPDRFVAYKRLMNKLGPFYRDVDDPGNGISRGPGYEALSKDMDLFVSTVDAVAKTISSGSTAGA